MEARQVGVLVQNASALFDFAEKPSLGTDFPKVHAVCQAYEQAGHELATLGHLQRATQYKANEEIGPLPFFGVLKHLRPVKERVIAHLRAESAGGVA